MFFSQKMLISVRLLAKYVIITLPYYTLGSAHGKFGIRIRAVSKLHYKAEITSWARWEEQLSFSKF